MPVKSMSSRRPSSTGQVFNPTIPASKQLGSYHPIFELFVHSVWEQREVVSFLVEYYGGIDKCKFEMCPNREYDLPGDPLDHIESITILTEHKNLRLPLRKALRKEGTNPMFLYRNTKNDGCLFGISGTGDDGKFGVNIFNLPDDTSQPLD